jgi:hypothetical protein
MTGTDEVVGDAVAEAVGAVDESAVDAVESDALDELVGVLEESVVTGEEPSVGLVVVAGVADLSVAVASAGMSPIVLSATILFLWVLSRVRSASVPDG